MAIQIDVGKLNQYLQDGNGPVMRHLMVAGEAFKMKTIQSLKEGFPREFVAQSLVKRIEIHDDGPHILVGAAVVKTRRHLIQGNPALVFFWPKVSQTVYFRKVNHPGSDFTAYINKKLLETLALMKGAL